MIGALSYSRCFNHGAREAVARCVTCQRFYCRECITEHDNRMLCRGCLASATAVVEKKAGAGWVAVWWGGALCSLVASWILFLALGRFLELLNG